MSDMSDLDSSESDWEGYEVITLPEITCLFCPVVFSCPENVFHHCRSEHNFDILAISKSSPLDAILYIKLINYIRTHKPTTSDLEQLFEDHPWTSDDYMKPATDNDLLLTFDIESLIEEQSKTNSTADTETVALPKSEYEALLKKLQTTQTQLENAWDRIERMKEMAKNVLYPIKDQCQEKSPIDDGSEADNYYFSSYDHFGIHHEMLQDKVRTLAYQEAILNNKETFSNKKVMDLGCGTAILSLFAVQAGALKVFAVDKSDVIYQATDIVRENGCEEVTEFFKGRIEETPFPGEKVDIIISEWMGYFLLFEGMLDSVLYARDRYLVPGGHIFPDRCTLSIAAVSDSEKYNECVDFWDDVYGFKMSVMKREVIKEANIETVRTETLCSDPVIIKELDLMTCSVQDTEFASEFNLDLNRDCRVTALVGFFDCSFEKDLRHKVVLSTSPLSTPTHWKQTVFLLPQPVEVKAGDRVACRLSCRKNRRDPRSLIIKINFGDAFNQYYLA